ncbi:MAG: D-amino acid aminotransferase, partial [Granulosicoccaceae bacterium]
SSTKEILPVTSLDGQPVGNGRPGPLWRQMLDYYQAYKQALRTGEAS